VRPTVTEQLEGLVRILQDVVVPEVTDPYPADILAGVCATLETLATGWGEVPAFLQWDAAASAQILSEVETAGGQHLTGPLADQVRSAVAASPPDPADLTALEAHHRRLRAALELAVPVIAEHEELSALRTHLVAVLRERAERYPLKTVWRPAAPTPAR
jgi:hypothetical protein